MGKTKYFAPNDIQRLSNPTALLNDVCINEGAALLQFLFCAGDNNARHYAILSTFVLPRVRSYCSDAELWRLMGSLEYWSKPVWIIPIHRTHPDHWVVCIAVPGDRQIFLFDSLAEQQRWPRDIKVCTFIKILYILFTVMTGYHDPCHSNGTTCKS